MIDGHDSRRLRDPARISAFKAALRSDASAQHTFDRLARIAARALRAPVAQVNFISEDQQISVSSVGPDPWAGRREVSLDYSYCERVVRTGEPFLIRDAREHPLVSASPATTEAGIVAYASVPLKAAGDLVLGTLCVVDFSPREWGDDEVEMLESLAAFVVAEIQRRNHSEAELLHLTAVLESAEDAVIGMDLEGTVTSWNPGAERLFGFTPHEMVGRSVGELVPPEASGEQEIALARLLRGESIPRFETERLRKDGSRVHVSAVLTPVRDLAGRVVGSTAVLRDLTDRVRMDRALQQSEARFRALIENNTDIITVLAADGTMKYESPAKSRILGYPPGSLVGRNAFEFLHPDDLPRVKEEFERVLEEAEPATAEYRFRHRDGSYRVLESTLTSLLAEHAVAGLVANSRDVTELRESGERLRQAQKMEAVGRLAGGIAHDFNNVLLVIKGRSAMALMDLPEEHPLREDVEEIDQAADRAANLTRQLLMFSRQQVVQPEVLELNEIVSQMERMLRRTLRADIEFLMLLDPEIGQIEVDPGHLEQILMNLCVNARDAMPSGGKLIIETWNADLSEPFTSQPAFEVRPGRYVALAVSDTGTGMPREVRERVFEPFFTTKPQGQGTGLGLATVYGIVQQSNGYIWVYSEEGNGTTFKIYLPRVDVAAERSGPEPPAIGSRRSATILLVEDESAVRSTARRMLERMGHTVLDAGEGEEALRIAAEHSGQIDVLMTDLIMPGMGGRKLAEMLAPSFPQMRVLYTSGYTDEVVIQQGILEGSASFLQKPYEPTALAEKLASILDGAGAED